MISVVLAGGRGVRLWPESTSQRPKQLCDFTGQGSLLNMTLQRLYSIGPLMVVCGQDQVNLISAELKDFKSTLLSEPVGRNTAPAVGLVLSGKDVLDSEVLGIFPSDHFIHDDGEFIRIVREAELLARDGYLVTIGITPEGPETGYGYIERRKDHEYEVKAFHEKPDRETAMGYIESGNYYWNAGIFIATARTWRSMIKEHLPELYIHMVKGRDDYIKAYDKLPEISIDYGIAEKCEKMAVIPGDFGWSDVGSWDALARVLKQNEEGNVVSGDALAVDCSGCLGRSSDKRLVLFGLKNTVVVETADTIMVCPKDRSQDIKKLVEIVESKISDVG